MIDSLRQVYNDIGEFYALKKRPLWPRVRAWVKSIGDGDSVLDVGCGEGRLLRGLEPGVDYTGIDFSEKLVGLAKKRYRGKNYKFITGDITKGDVWKGLKRFDKIFAIAVVHHLPSRQEQLYVLRKIKEHLNPGGKVYISFWNLWQKKFLSEHFKCLGLKFEDLPDSFRWVKIPFAGTKLKRFYFAGTQKYWKRLMVEVGWKKREISFNKNKKNMWVILG